jgi:hypothetical protein
MPELCWWQSWRRNSELQLASLNVSEHRNLSYVDYSVHELLAQGVYGIVLGYEDVNDQDKLRYDPALALALGRLDFIDSNAALLAGKAQLID